MNVLLVISFSSLKKYLESIQLQLKEISELLLKL